MSNKVVSNKAMALVEIVVSMLVLSVAALGVSATISMVNSREMRSAGGSSLDLQALSFARQTLEVLKSFVSADPSKAAKLAGSAEGTEYTSASDAMLGLPVGGDLANHSGARTYKVWDVDANGDGTTDYKKVTATVTWTD